MSESPILRICTEVTKRLHGKDMQKMHDFMFYVKLRERLPQSFSALIRRWGGCMEGPRTATTDARSDRCAARARGSSHCGPDQAIETAMKASRKIKTAPASGRTSGISGKTASTASGLAASLWRAGADMVRPFQKMFSGF